MSSPIGRSTSTWITAPLRFLTYSAWLSSGKKFLLYYMEAGLGTQTQNFFPSHYVDITSVEERTHQAWLADTVWYDKIWALHDLMRRMRGGEHDCKVAEAFNHHPKALPSQGYLEEEPW